MLVRGWEKCESKGFPVQTPDSSGMLSYRNFGLDCTVIFNDPRVSGLKTGPNGLDIWGNPMRAAVVEWGERTITNADGSWVGLATGIFTNDTGDVITIWFRGTGAYAGLSFVEWLVAPPFTVDVGYPVTGLIFPGDVPPPFGER